MVFKIGIENCCFLTIMFVIEKLNDCNLRVCFLTPGEDFAVVQQEIIMMKDCKHSNIVAYFGSYLR